MRARLQNNQDFRTRMLRQQEKNRLALQQAIYTDLSAINPHILQSNGCDINGNPIYLFYGDLQPHDDKLLQKLYLYVCKWFFEELGKRNITLQLQKDPKDLKPKQPPAPPRPKFSFLLIYFNTLCESSSRYDDFRNIIRSMSPAFILALKNIIVVRPTLRVKTLDWIVFGTVNGEIKDKTDYADKIQKLDKFGVLVEEGFLMGVRKEVRDVDYKPNKDKGKEKDKEEHRHKEQTKNPRNNIQQFKRVQNQAFSEYASLQKIFGKENRKSLEDYEVSQIGVPLILKTLVMCLRTDGEFLDKEGIFRKSVSIEQQRQAVNHLIKQDYEYLQNIDNPYLVATLIKRFLSNLSQPLFTYTLFPQLSCLNPQSADCLPTLHSLVHSLPPLNYATLMFLLSFFVKDIIPRHNVNKMTEYNSAVCLVPCLMWSKDNSLEDMKFGKNLVKVLELILKNFQTVFGREEEQTEFYRKSSRRSMRKFRNKIFKKEKGDQPEDEEDREDQRKELQEKVQEQQRISKVYFPDTKQQLPKQPEKPHQLEKPKQPQPQEPLQPPTPQQQGPPSIPVPDIGQQAPINAISQSTHQKPTHH